jgi:hypothetical protein
LPETAVRSENAAVDHTSVIATPSLAVVPAAPTHRLNGRRARLLALATLSAAALLMALVIPVGTHDWPYLAEGARLLWSRNGLMSTRSALTSRLDPLPCYSPC